MQRVAFGETKPNGCKTMVKITKVDVPGYLANNIALPPFELSISTSHLVTAAPTSQTTRIPSANNYSQIAATISSPNTIPDSEIQSKMQQMVWKELGMPASHMAIGNLRGIITLIHKLLILV